MAAVIVLTSILMCYILVFRNGVEAKRWKLSKSEDLEFERRLKLLNKPAIKTIYTDYGDIYDCMEFYKQPAFDNPLLNNHIPTTLKISPSLQKEDEERGNFMSSLRLTGGGCPTGTVPIKRITKQDLIREKLASSRISFASNDNNGSHYAICHTIDGEQGPLKYKGAGAIISSHNPSPVSRQQSSAARLRLLFNGQDSIEVGWRVDPTLYGDSKTRLYVHTRVGQTNCFNTICPGFVATNTDIPLGAILEPISQQGGPIYETPYKIIYDETEGKWIVQVGPDYAQVGYWPKSIFSTSDLPNYVEWGGETFNSPDETGAPMGSGHNIRRVSTKKDAFMRKLKVINENGQEVDPITETYLSSLSRDGVDYDIKVKGRVDDFFEYLVFYGGPGKVCLLEGC